MTSPVVKGDPEADEIDSELDVHPADEDEGGRTIASIPEFELPKDVPSPLGSAPPPPASPRLPPRASPASPVAAPRPGGPPRPGAPSPAAGRLPPASARVPVPVAVPPIPDPQADNPTMHAGQSVDTFMPKEDLRSSRGMRTAPVQLPPLETSGLLEDTPRRLDDETTKSVSREDLFGSSQMLALQQQVRERAATQEPQQVIVGEDDGAMGDEATLAVAPGQLGDLRPASQRFGNVNVTESSNIGGIGQALAETLAAPSSQQPYAPPPPPPTFGQGPPPSQPTALMQQLPQAAWPQPQPAPAPWSPPMQQQQQPMPMPMQPQPMQQAPMAQRPVPQPTPVGAAVPRKPIPTQLIVLGIVGVVCLAIFVTGIWLFVTTKF